jgi:hypothetical protein
VISWAAPPRRRTSASTERSAPRKAAEPPLASMSATARASRSASRPCTSTPRRLARGCEQRAGRPRPSSRSPVPTFRSALPLGLSPHVARRARLLRDAGSSKSSFSEIKTIAAGAAGCNLPSSASMREIAVSTRLAQGAELATRSSGTDKRPAANVNGDACRERRFSGSGTRRSYGRPVPAGSYSPAAAPTAGSTRSLPSPNTPSRTRGRLR